jgi:hypothetical protein
MTEFNSNTLSGGGDRRLRSGCDKRRGLAQTVWSTGVKASGRPLPPRDPDDEDDEEEDDDIEREDDREPAVIREPDEDE